MNRARTLPGTGVRAARAALLLAVAALALGVSAVDVGARPKPAPEPVLAPPPPPPPMPDVSMSRRLTDEAAAYQGYLRRAMQIAPSFTDAAAVAQSLKQGAAYEPAAFIHGAVAYAAIAALQDPTFVASVRAAGNSAYNRGMIVNQIYANPASVFGFAGSQGAASLAKQALTADGMRLFNLGLRVKQSAYDMQRQAWSKQDVADRDTRLASVKSLSAGALPIAPEDSDALQRAAGGSGLGLSAEPARPPYSQMVSHAVALAALAAIGQAGDEDADHLRWLADEANAGRCASMAKLNLYQCLAVARPNYEDVFCLGQHAMADTGACLVKGGGGAVPLEVSTAPLKIPPVGKAAKHAKRRKS